MGAVGTQNGPGYSDVADFLIELSRTWGGLHRFRLAADRDRRGIPVLFVVLEHTPVHDSGDGRGSVRTWSNFPCKGNLTFAGVLYRLCFELNEKLERRRLEREQQTVF